MLMRLIFHWKCHFYVLYLFLCVFLSYAALLSYYIFCQLALKDTTRDKAHNCLLTQQREWHHFLEALSSVPGYAFLMRSWHLILLIQPHTVDWILPWLALCRRWKKLKCHQLCRNGRILQPSTHAWETVAMVIRCCYTVLLEDLDV